MGVTAPGSSTNFFVNYLMAKAGADPKQAAFIGVGAGLECCRRMEHGELDAIVNLDPVISKLEADGAIQILADTRTEEGTRTVFGGANPAAVVYLKNSFIEANPNTTQAIVDAFKKALDWLATAQPEDIVASVPEAYYLGDRELYLRAVKASEPTYSRHRHHRARGGCQSALCHAGAVRPGAGRCQGRPLQNLHRSVRESCTLAAEGCGPARLTPAPLGGSLVGTDSPRGRPP